MFKTIVASLLSLSLCACPLLTGTHGEPGTGEVSSHLTLGSTFHDVTVSARDLNANREITNTETYPVLDHGFALELPAGRYDIELTDARDHMIARYPGVVVNGDMSLGAPIVSDVPAQP